MGRGSPSGRDSVTPGAHRGFPADPATGGTAPAGSARCFSTVTVICVLWTPVQRGASGSGPAAADPLGTGGS